MNKLLNSGYFHEIQNYQRFSTSVAIHWSQSNVMLFIEGKETAMLSSTCSSK